MKILLLKNDDFIGVNLVDYWAEGPKTLVHFAAITSALPQHYLSSIFVPWDL